MTSITIKDLDWLEQASLQEMQDAIRTEPPESDLFQGTLGMMFWQRYKEQVGEVYGGSVA